MINYIYDQEAKALYVSLAGPQDRVGTLAVSGDIKFRRPGKVVPFDGTLLLDFTEEGQLAGIEVLGSRIPQNLTRPQPFSVIRMVLEPASGSFISDAEREANSIHNHFVKLGVKPEVYFWFNDKLYISRGTYCELAPEG